MDIFFVCIGMIAIIFIFKLFKMEWESPAGINIIFNSLMIFCSMIAFGKNQKWEYIGIIWIMLSCISFLLGQRFGWQIKDKKKGRRLLQKESLNTREFTVDYYHHIICMVCVFLGILNIILTIQKYGFHVSQMFEMDSLLSINGVIAYDRYYGNSSTNVFQAVLNMITYFAAIYGGYLFTYSFKIKEKAISLFTLLPPICVSLITNTKSGLIFSIVLWGIGWFISEKAKNPKRIIINSKIICLGIICFAGLMLLLRFVMMLRIGSFSLETSSIVGKKMLIYAFGQVSAFDTWLGNVDDFPYGFGSNTFMTFTNWLGITVRQQGVYTDTARVGEAVTNVYTRYRGEILDYGILGAQIFEFVLGVLAGACWKKISTYGNYASAASITMLAAIYFMIVEGMVVSPWVYTSYTVAFVLFGFMLYAIKNIKIKIRIKGCP